MANHKSALKRAHQNEKKRIRNKAVKTKVKNVIKNVRIAVNENVSDLALTTLNAAKSAIDAAARKGVLHKRTAARKISRITKLVNGITK